MVAPGGNLVLRSAHLGDAPRVASLHVATWQTAYRGLLPADYLDGLSVDSRAASWRSFISGSPCDHLVLAEASGELVGFASCGPDAETGSAGELYTLYVGADGWGTGIGRSLITASCDLLAADGFDEVFLWVLATNERARGFYQHLGWAWTNTVRTQVFGGKSVTDHLLRRSLRDGQIFSRPTQ